MMKTVRFKPLLWVLVCLMVLGLTACSDDDDDTTPTGVTYPTGSLVSAKTTTLPSSNATVDALWANVEGISISTTVATYDINVDGHDIWWDDYEGMTIDMTMKSVYTDDDIYFLCTWNDSEDSKTRQAWYYNTNDGNVEDANGDVIPAKWLQMGKKYPDEFGNPPAYEDKITFFWDITMDNFENSGCATLCHGQYMATNGAGQRADIWHWKRDRTGPVSQIDDKWLNDDQNGRHGDEGTGAYSSNTHDLVTTSHGTISAPNYWIPGATDYHWITQADMDAGVAREIVDMNADGDWVDEDGTVLLKAEFGYTSNKVIPSLMGIKPGTGSRGDVSAWHNWADGTWTLKIKRARDTGTDDDVQYTTLGVPYLFSVGIMNNAAIAHATPGGYAGTAYQLILSE